MSYSTEHARRVALCMRRRHRRTICSVCQEEHIIRDDGTLKQHVIYGWLPYDAVVCDGSEIR